MGKIGRFLNQLFIGTTIVVGAEQVGNEICHPHQEPAQPARLTPTDENKDVNTADDTTAEEEMERRLNDQEEPTEEDLKRDVELMEGGGWKNGSKEWTNKEMGKMNK